MPAIPAPDDLSQWTLPPPAALARGEAEPIRTFDTAEAAIAFLAQHGGGGDAGGTRSDGSTTLRGSPYASSAPAGRGRRSGYPGPGAASAADIREG